MTAFLQTPAAPQQRHEAFLKRCATLGITLDRRLFWYHTVELDSELVTPGSFDYRRHVADFHFPSDMRNMRALDVGPATGFFAFEFERRGAAVATVELPSLQAWDHFPGEASDQIIRKMRALMPYHQVWSAAEINDLFDNSTAEELYGYLLDAPFKFCHGRLRSRVRRHYATIYDLANLDLDGSFDLVFVGDVLLHTINPLAALAAAAAQCRGEMIIAQQIPDGAGSAPMLTFVGGERQGEDAAVWWTPNLAWFTTVLRRLGFATVQVTGRFAHTVHPAGHLVTTTVISARRGPA